MTTDNTQELIEQLTDLLTSMNLYRHTEPDDRLVDFITAYTNKQIEEVLDRLKQPTIADVFPSEPYDGSKIYEDMLSVVKYYEGLVQAERNKLKERDNDG